MLGTSRKLLKRMRKSRIIGGVIAVLLLGSAGAAFAVAARQINAATARRIPQL